MERLNEVLYTVSLEDATPRASGVKVARGHHFDETFSLPTSGRPPLEHVLNWIDAKAEDIRKGIKEMQANPSTEVVRLNSRFPIGVAAGGHHVHLRLPGIDVDGLEIERLKAKVIDVYENAGKR